MVEGDKITLIIEGQRVEGEIAKLLPNDITVHITAPYTEGTTGLHVPHFAMYRQNWLQDEQGQITSRGVQKTERLLTEIYAQYQNRGVEQ